MCGEGKTEREREVCRRVQTEANAWRAVERDGGPADLKKTKWKGHEHLCNTDMPVRNENFGTDRTTTTQAASVRKQLGTKNSKSKEGRQEKDGPDDAVKKLRQHLTPGKGKQMKIERSAIIAV